MDWKRTKYLGNGRFIEEEFTLDNQKVVLEFLIRNNGDPEPMAYYYQHNTLVNAFKLKSTTIDKARNEAIFAVVTYINEKVIDWSNMLSEWGKGEDV